MNQANARRYVLLSIFALLALEVYRGKLQTQQVGLAKRLWGVGVVSIALSLLADVAPTIAGPFAVLVFVGALTNKADAVARISGTEKVAHLTDIPNPKNPISPQHPGANK